MKKILSCAFACLLLLLPFGACGGPPAGDPLEELHIAPAGSPWIPEGGFNFGGFTPEEAQSQTQAAQKLYDDILASYANGDAQFNIPEGVYRLMEDGIPTFAFRDMKDFKIIGGENVHFLQTQIGHDSFLVASCENLGIEGIKFDCESLPFAQGTITGIDMKAKRMTMELDEGYAFPPNINDIANGFGGLFIKVFESASYTDDVGWQMRDRATAFTKTGDNTYTFGCTYGLYFTKDYRVKIGGKISVAFISGGSALNVQGSESLTVRDVDIYSACGFCIVEQGGAGGHTYENVRIIPRPGTNRLVSGASDGYHSMLANRGATLERCEIAATSDDSINVHGFFNVVSKKISDTEFEMVSFALRGVAPGTEIYFADLVKFTPRSQSRIESIELVDDDDLRAKMRSGFQNMVLWKKFYNVRSFPGAEVYRVKLSSPAEFKEFDLAYSYGENGTGLTVRDCYLHDIPSVALLTPSADVTIENCRFERIGYQAILLSCDNYWLEGPFPKDITVENNTFTDIGRNVRGLALPAAVAVSLNGKNYANKIRFDNFTIQNIKINNNTFRDCTAAAVMVFNAQRVEIKGNVIDNVRKQELHKDSIKLFKDSGVQPDGAACAVYLAAVKDADLSGNTFLHNSPFCGHDILLGKNTGIISFT